MSRLVLAAAAIAFLVTPAPALAQGFYGPFQPQEDYGPGITVSGSGFAPLGHRDRATARAVGDARRRAEAIAAELGVSVGEARAAELSTPFDPRPACVHRHTGRCAQLDAVSAVVTFAIAGGPTSDDGAREVEGTGNALDRVEVERQTSPAIRGALRAMRLDLSPAAARVARSNAEAAAGASGIPLGQLFSVVEPSAAVYGYDPTLGNFGPGQFCAMVRRVTGHRDPETGEFHLIRHKPVRRCNKPRVAVQLEVTYLGG
jgi:hypothetical protein